MSERILIGLVGTVARDLLFVFIWHRVIAQTVPTVRAQAIATVAGVFIGLVMLAARWWTNLWRTAVPAGPAIAVRCVVWAMFLVTAGFATAMDPRLGAVAWALVVSTGAPALAPMASYLRECWHWRPRKVVDHPRPALIRTVAPRQRVAATPRLAFETSGDGT